MIRAARRRASWHILAHLGVGFAMLGCSTQGEGKARPEERAGHDAGARGGAGGAYIGVGGSSGGPSDDAGCRRDVTLQAVTLGKPPPFDVVIVADNSDSLSWSRSDLSSGLSDFLSDVRGRAVRVFLLTPTQYGDSSGLAQVPLSGDPVVDWKDAASGKPYANAVTTYAQTCTDPSQKSIPCPSSKGSVPYQVHGVWSFQMPPPIAVITPELDATEFAAQQKSVRDAILALGGGGSPHEQPICTLARYVSQDHAVLPTHAVFVVISDEDDQSTPADCAATYDAALQASAGQDADACSAGCDAYRYSAMADLGWRRSMLECASFDDTGKQIAGTERETWLNVLALPSCDGFSNRPCTTDEITQAAPICPTETRLVSCQATCAPSVYPCQVDLPDSTVDACTHPFTKDGVPFANLADFCQKTSGGVGTLHACSSGGIKYRPFEGLAGTYQTSPLMPGTSTADMILYFKTQAYLAFGADRFLVEAITLAPSSSCALGPGQSYATNLVQLATGPENVFSLCQSYAGALRGVLDFSQNLIQTEFSVPLAADEDITTVHVVTQNGDQRTLRAADYRYDRASQRLQVQESALGPTDATLRVEVTSDCRPIIR